MLRVFFVGGAKFVLAGATNKEQNMKQKITFWQEPDGMWLGYLNDYPDHWTQGDDPDDLKQHLRDLYREFGKGDIPGIRRVEEIEVG